MLRRPISTVLSSLSIGSRLSTRLFCASAASTNDQIPTVRTAGARWAKHYIKNTMNGIYWGKGDPRNTKVENGNDPMDKQGRQIRSILMALEQAQKDGLKKIRVQTDFPRNELFIRKMLSKSFTEKTEPNLTKYMYCERILKIMDKMEVILEYRKPWTEDRDGNEVFMLPNQELFSGGSNTIEPSADCTISPKNANTNGRTLPTEFSGSTVRTTGFGWTRDGSRDSFHGIYWGKGDLRNRIDQRKNDMTDTRGRMLRSIMTALDQAMKSGLRQIRVQTDSDLNEFDIRRMADKFKNGDLTALADIHLAKYDYCDKIVKIMDEIEVIIEYVPAWNEGSGNEVMSLLKREEEANKLSSTLEIITNGVPSLENRIVPTVYVRGDRNNARKMGASAYLWNPESIEHLDINQRPVDSSQRLSIDPLTYFRVQMLAILNAIKEAHYRNLPEILLITYSLPFVEKFTRDWKDARGNPFENEDLYLEIKALTETTKVHFKGVQVTNEYGDKLLTKVLVMAKEEAGLPVDNVKKMLK